MRKQAPAGKTVNTKSLSPTSKLFARAQKNEKQAMEDLVNRIHDRLYRFCYCLTGNRQRAQDLCQDAYVKVLENIDSLEDPRYFVPWLFKVTKNHFLDYLKSPRNAAYLELKDFSEVLAHSSGADVAVQLSRKLGTLTPEERYIVLLICLEGRSYVETAEILGVTEEALRCKLYRVRKSFKGDFLTGNRKR